MSPKIILFIASALAVATSGWAALAERRRHKRNDLDNVGWVPWTLVQVVASIVAVGLFAFAIKIPE